MDKEQLPGTPKVLVVTRSDDIVFAITNKEETMKDKFQYPFMVFIFPIIGACIHCLATIWYLERYSK